MAGISFDSALPPGLLFQRLDHSNLFRDTATGLDPDGHFPNFSADDFGRVVGQVELPFSPIPAGGPGSDLAADAIARIRGAHGQVDARRAGALHQQTAQGQPPRDVILGDLPETGANAAGLLWDLGHEHGLDPSEVPPGVLEQIQKLLNGDTSTPSPQAADSIRGMQQDMASRGAHGPLTQTDPSQMSLEQLLQLLVMWLQNYGPQSQGGSSRPQGPAPGRAAPGAVRSRPAKPLPGNLPKAGEVTPGQDGVPPGLRPNAARGAKLVREQFGFKGTIGGIGHRSGKSDHPHGNAIDVMTNENKQLGQEIADYFRQHHEELGVKYVIFNQRIASAKNGWQWRPMADRGSPTANHEDHPHISFY